MVRPYRSLALLAALGALAFALFLLAPNDRGEQDVESPLPASAEEREAVELADAARPAERRAERGPVPVPVDDAAAADATSSTSSTGAAPPLSVSGRVVEGRSAEPVQGAAVRLIAPGDAVTTETDAEGRFRLELPSDLWRFGETYRASVALGDGQSLFLGSIVLAPELHIRARMHFRLHGRLVSNLDPAQRTLYVHARVPAEGAVQVDVYAGLTQLDDAGAFSIEAWADREPASFALAFGDARGFFLVAEVPTAELVSLDGATIECHLGELVLEVRGESGAPVEAADARLSSARLDERTWCDGSTDAKGRVSFLAPPGPLELCVAKEGYSFAHARLELTERAERRVHEVLLRTLRDDERVTGRALDAHGDPVEAAYVSAGPVTDNPELSVAAHVGTRSDAEGTFELAIGGELPIEVNAHHGDLGMARPVVLAPGERNATLRFEALGLLEVRVTGTDAVLQTRAGSVQWLVLDPVSERSYSGHRWGLPFTIDELPVGSYELFVHLAESELLGRTTARVTAGATSNVTVPLSPARTCHGTLLHADDSPAAGLTVRLNGGRPAELVHTWGQAVCDAEGRFRVLLGDWSSSRARVFDAEGSERGSLELVPGTHIYRLK